MNATILVVEDDPQVRELLRDHLASLDYRILTAASAEAALALLDRDVPDLVLTDVHMGAMSGIELCARVKADPRFRLTPVVILTAVADLAARISGLAAGADDFFPKPFHLVELRTRLGMLLKAKFLVDQLEHAEGVISTLGRTIEARDPYTHGHCERLGRYAVALGSALGLQEAALKALWLGGSLHDLGKIAVPDRILLKPGALTPEERGEMQAHPAAGEALVRGLKTLDSVRPIIRHHHERWDGTGYPDRLRGEAIPVEARIMAVVDVWDALVTQRPYKAALSPEEAMKILVREAEAGAWDPEVVARFLELSREGRLP